MGSVGARAAGMTLTDESDEQRRDVRPASPKRRRAILAALSTTPILTTVPSGLAHAQGVVSVGTSICRQKLPFQGAILSVALARDNSQKGAVVEACRTYSGQRLIQELCRIFNLSFCGGEAEDA